MFFIRSIVFFGCKQTALILDFNSLLIQGTYGKIMGSRPVIVLLSQLLMIPLHQPLLGHMVQQCQQKPPQSASAMETLGSLLFNHPPIL